MIVPENIIADFLNIILIDNVFIFVNVWSFVHLVSGFLLYRFVTKKFLFIFLLLLVYELFEILFYTVLFIPEIGIDIVWDLIIGMFGSYIAYKWFNWKRINNKDGTGFGTSLRLNHRLRVLHVHAKGGRVRKIGLRLNVKGNGIGNFNSKYNHL